jgi:hypothetical protein
MNEEIPLVASESQMIQLARRPHLVPVIISAAMLVAALGKWPYGYFVLMRWVLCSSAVFVAVVAYGSRRHWGTWLYGLVALLFNPAIPVRLSRGTWRPLDVVAANALVIAGIFVSRGRETTKD